MAEAASCIVKKDALERFACDLLHAGGYSFEEARGIAASLVLSNLIGHDSHGVIRVKEYIDALQNGFMRSGVELKILNETQTSCQADGLVGPGQVQIPRLLDKLFAKADNQAVVTGAILNCGHLGRLGEWVDRAAERGLAAFMCVNDNGTLHSVSPAPGAKGRTSTNPLAFAVPMQNDEVFSIDMSTSAIAMGKLRLAYLNGEPAPEGTIIDADGNPTTNAAVLFEEPKGSILPFGGYKGFALSMMVDCLSAGLSGGFAPPAPQASAYANNAVICLWNPRFFAGLSHMQSEAQKYVDFVRESGDSVRAPGDRAKAVYEERVKKGVPLSAPFAAMMARYAEKMGVSAPAAITN